MIPGVFSVTRQDRKFFLVRVLVLLPFFVILFTALMEVLSHDRNFFLENIVVLLMLVLKPNGLFGEQLRKKV